MLYLSAACSLVNSIIFISLDFINFLILEETNSKAKSKASDISLAERGCFFFSNKRITSSCPILTA